MGDESIKHTEARSRTWNVVDPSRPWVPLTLTASESGVTVKNRRGSTLINLPWDDFTDVRTDGVSGFWGLRMALFIESKNQPVLRFLCPRFSLAVYPHDRALDIAHEIREIRGGRDLHLV